MLTGDEPATRPGLLVTGEHLAAGPHAELRCVECHQDAAQPAAPGEAQPLHPRHRVPQRRLGRLRLSTHNEAFAGADDGAPTSNT